MHATEYEEEECVPFGPPQRLASFSILIHGILLDRLSNLGVGGVMLQWFTSFLSDKSQKVVVGHCCLAPEIWSAKGLGALPMHQITLSHPPQAVRTALAPNDPQCPIQSASLAYKVLHSLGPGYLKDHLLQCYSSHALCSLEGIFFVSQQLAKLT